MSEDDFFDQMDEMLGVAPTTPLTPEEKLYSEFVNTTPNVKKYEQIGNVDYWLKMELYVIYDLADELDWKLFKPAGASRKSVNNVELVRALLRYFFQMHHLPRFQSERPEMAHKLANMDKFLDMIMAHPLIKARIENPRKKGL